MGKTNIMSAEELSEDDVMVTLSEFVVTSGGERRIEVDIDGKLHSLEPRPIYEFERDLVDNIIEASIDSSVSGNAVPIKGRWIHGWLNAKGEDYINNTWHGYQYFLKYLEAITGNVENISQYNRSPGTYDSMYRYLLVLEDIGLVERYRREEVSEDEYDFNVPEEFRTRTFLRLTGSYEGNERLWNNPIGSVYGQDEEPEVDDEPQEAQTEPEPEESSVPDTGLGQFTGRTDETEEVESSGSYNLPAEDASITEFEDIDQIPVFIQNNFREALENAYEKSPVQIIGAGPEDIELGRVSITGPWAAGNAVPGETPLDLFIELTNDSQEMNPGFLTGSIAITLPEILQSDNPFESVFSSYDTQASYSSSYKSQLKRVVTRGEEDVYYSYDSQSIEEVE